MMKKKGFTLIEMFIVIVIIGILAGALIPRIGTARDKANDTAREANVRSLATALVSYGMDHNGYPSSAVATNGGETRDAGYSVRVPNTPAPREPIVIKKDDGKVVKRDPNKKYEDVTDLTAYNANGLFVSGTVTSLTLDLQSYGISNDNFIDSPTQDDAYYYNTTADGEHFVVFTMLSDGIEGIAGNCDFSTVSRTGLTYDELNSSTDGNSFCYFQ